MESLRNKEVWAAGDRYERYVGRWSRVVAPGFLDWLGVAERQDWLDLGCGTGALSQAILERRQPRHVLGIDASAGFVSHARADIVDGRAEFVVADARFLPVESASRDAVVSGLVLNFVPEPSRALAEIRRVLRPRGLAAAYVWDYAEGMELMRRFWDAAVALDPGAAELDEGRRFPICRPGPLAASFDHAGFTRVEVRAIEIATAFHDFDDYWTPFLGGQGPAPGYAMSLSEERRNALRDRIRSELPFAEDGSIRLLARAWAVRARVEAEPAATEIERED